MSIQLLLSNYDVNFAKTLRSCLSISNKIIRIDAQKKFLFSCKQNNIYPNSFKIKSPVPSVKARRYAANLSQKFISLALDNCFATLHKLKIILHRNLSFVLSTCVNSDSLTVLDYLKFKNSSVHRSQSLKFKKKFSFLYNKFRRSKDVPPPPPDNWIHNVSSHSLSSETMHLLSKGFNYAIGSTKINIPSTLSSIENGIQYFPRSTKSKIRSYATKSILVHQRFQDKSIRKSLSILKDIKSDESLRILKSDKGNSTVIMDASDYNSKMYDILNDSTSFEKLKKDNTKSVGTNLLDLTSSLVKTGCLSRDQATILNCYTGLSPPIYGSPKIHKPNCPLRPIVNFKRSPLFDLSSFLSNILKPFIIRSPHYINSSSRFIDSLKASSIPPGSVMVSFDVISLYSSIPIDVAVSSVRDFLSNLPSSDLLSLGIDIDTFFTLLDFCLQNNSFNFDGSFYKQIKGTAMGSPVSVPIAEIVMQVIELKILNQFKMDIFYWVRYVDDTFAIINIQKLHDILYFANNIQPAIQFTYELESENCSLPFLDVLVFRSDSSPFQSFEFSVYRKPTHTGRYLNFASSCPISHKIAVMKSLFNRAKIFCSNQNLLNIEINKITSDLKLNSYPHNFIRNFMLNFFNSPSTFQVSSNSPSSPPSSPPIFKRFTLPYFPGFSESLAHFCRKLNVLLSFKADNKIMSIIGMPYPPCSSTDRLGVVYNIPCKSCKLSYFGETGRTFHHRLAEHKSNLKNRKEKSRLVSHAILYDHLPDWKSSKIVASNLLSFRSRKFIEGFFSAKSSDVINEYTPVPPEFHVFLQFLK